MLALGEVHTTNLMHSVAAPPAVVEQVLALVPGERVRTSTRPIAHAVSPQTYIGIDCGIPASRSQLHGIGTLAARASVTGGRVVQADTYVSLRRSEAGRRLAWSHYLARLGVVETLGRGDPAGAGEAHLRSRPEVSAMGLGAVSARLLSTVQQSGHLDRQPPFLALRTVLRWVAYLDATQQRCRFTVEDDGLRTLRLDLPSGDLNDTVALCEDIARHDWLLSTVMSMVDRSRIGVADPVEVITRLRPAIDHLLHLWMPAAGLGGTAREVWAAVELRPGMSRQWDASVTRIRDQLTMGAALLGTRDTHRVGFSDATI